MECNKDEAFRATKIAERKLTEKNYSGAKKFALKAQNLYPGLEVISQLLMTIDVYIAAEKRINGEVDWYAVLGTNSWDDDETVRKQYQKLALSLHPGKNKVMGGDGAFKLVSEAWSFLSDKAKRLVYNEKLNLSGPQKYPTQTGVSFASSSANGIHTSTNYVTPPARVQNNATQTSSTTVPYPNQKPGTFWTICDKCCTQYEYLRIYLNNSLRCPSCNEAFLAVERPPPSNAFKSRKPYSRRQHNKNSRLQSANSKMYKSGGSPGLDSSNSTNLHWGSFSSAAGGSSNISSSTATQAATVGQQVHEKLKRECDNSGGSQGLNSSNNTNLHWGSLSSGAGGGSSSPTATQAANVGQQVHEKLKREREEAEEAALKKRRLELGNQMSMGSGAGSGIPFEFRRSRLQAENMYGFSHLTNKLNRERELALFEMRKMLVHKARSEICKKLQEWSLETAAKATGKEKEKSKGKESRKPKSTFNGDLQDPSKCNGSNSKNQNKDTNFGSSDGDLDKKAPALSINVPDSDFHNFDLDRTESSFGDDQVWAAYDDDDGMPRYYARIHKVISSKPFKMKISWLNSRSNSELGPLRWVESGFTKTCGDFRTGKHEASETLNAFSHKVTWRKGARGIIHIFPSKGDIWALYRNWSPDWDQRTPDNLIHTYDMVEVLADFNEELGVFVAPLVKVSGFRTVFQKHMDPNEVRRIPKEEMFRFSHQVPSILLSGKEADNVPAGSWELDPAATPLDLLQVTTEACDEKLAENGGKADEESFMNTPKVEVAEIAESSKQTDDQT